MDAEKRQKTRAAVTGGMRTTKKPIRKAKSIIGSSSTWKEDELFFFKVKVEDVIPKDVIPEKWFDFGRLNGYQEGIIHASLPMNTDCRKGCTIVNRGIRHI